MCYSSCLGSWLHSELPVAGADGVEGPDLGVAGVILAAVKFSEVALSETSEVGADGGGGGDAKGRRSGEGGTRKGEGAESQSEARQRDRDRGGTRVEKERHLNLFSI